MLVQEIDDVSINSKKLQYFSPNNIGLLLSINSSFTEESERLFKETIENLTTESKNDVIEILNQTSSIICNYIERVQIAIVFGFTALETFANLSIPYDYEYKKQNKSKGTDELYGKESIERWIGLKDKFNISYLIFIRQVKLKIRYGGDISVTLNNLEMILFIKKQ